MKLKPGEIRASRSAFAGCKLNKPGGGDCSKGELASFATAMGREVDIAHLRPTLQCSFHPVTRLRQPDGGRKLLLPSSDPRIRHTERAAGQPWNGPGTALGQASRGGVGAPCTPFAAHTCRRRYPQAEAIASPQSGSGRCGAPASKLSEVPKVTLRDGATRSIHTTA